MDDQALVDALESSQGLGMLGQRPIAEVVEHAMSFVDALGGITGVVVDLGSGGGVPGLVIARARPDLQLILVDRRATRVDHLRRLVHRLDLARRVEILAADAAHLVLAAPADAIVARGFGAPAKTIRRAVPLLAPDGLIVVSEPPEHTDDRWPTELLVRLGLDRIPHEDRRVACFRRSDVSRGTSTSTQESSG